MFARDSTAAGDSTASPTRLARFAFPTEGGVFYYRAGSGSGIRRPSAAPSAVTPRTPASAMPLATATESRTEIAPEATAVRDGAAASGVTQRDLDRLENRLLNALDRRLAALARERERDADRRPDVVTGSPRDETPRADRTVLVPVPVPAPERPVGQLPDRPRDSTPEATPVRPETERPETAPPVATVEQIERDILDTGLFRTTFVNFEFAKADLIPISKQTLDALVTVLSRYAALRIEIGGHTDDVGSDATNDVLSQRRAESVADYLASQGISRQRLTARGFGENRPVASNATDTGRALNRRVEFLVLNPEDAERIRR